MIATAGRYLCANSGELEELRLDLSLLYTMEGLEPLVQGIRRNTKLRVLGLHNTSTGFAHRLAESLQAAMEDTPGSRICDLELSGQWGHDADTAAACCDALGRCC